MATAKQVDGVSIVAYVNGVAVDSEGKAVPGAPKPPKDTDPSEQPGALGGPTSEERIGIAIARAIKDPKGTLEPKKPAAKKDDDEPEVPVVEKTASQKAGELSPAATEPAAAPAGKAATTRSARKSAAKKGR